MRRTRMLRSEISRRGAERQRRGAFGRAGAPRTPQKGAPTGMKKSLIAIVVVLLVGAGMAKRAVAANNGRAQTPAAPQTEQPENGRARSPSAPQTGNLSKLRRDELIGKIGEIKSFLEKSSDTNAVRLLRFAAEVEREVREKKFGLVFEEHCENIDMLLEENLPVLTEVKKRYLAGKSAKDDSPLNFLIEGDNLAALKLLKKTHRGKIDFIYIDPPYNTGKKDDFKYNDSIVDKTDTFRHSKWLSFMEKRLVLAHALLSPIGVIFISLNEIEQPSCRILCDAIFGDSNFCGQIIWRKKAGGGQTDEFFVTEHEYVLVYRKSPLFVWIDDTIEADAGFNKEDEVGKFKAVKLEKWGSSAHKEDRITMWFSITDPDGKKMFPQAPDGLPGRWRVGKKRMEDLERNGWIHWEKKNGRWVPYEKIYSEDGNLTKIKTVKCRSIFYDEVGETGDASNMLTHLFGKKDVFLNPKPVSLIEELLSHAKAKTVLDFFAGSGTTGHAVMKLNAEDGGKRKFILVTNNENGICEKVTYERLKRVMEKEKYNARLKYMKIGYQDISGKLYYEYADDLLKHIRELVELENAVDFAHDKSIAIVLTQKELDALVTADARLSSCRVVYAGHDVTTTATAKRAFAKYGIEKREIPEYYYPELEK